MVTRFSPARLPRWAKVISKGRPDSSHGSGMLSGFGFLWLLWSGTAL